MQAQVQVQVQVQARLLVLVPRQQVWALVTELVVLTALALTESTRKA